MMLIEQCLRAAETIGLIALEAIGVANFVIIGTITAATVVGATVLVAGSIGLSLYLNRQRPSLPEIGGPSLPPPESGHVPIKQATPPRIVGYGRVRLGGAYVLFEANGASSYDIVALHHGRIQGIFGWYLHDDVVVRKATGYVDVLGDGRYGGDLVYLNYRLGAATETAYGEITGVPGLAPIWTSAHRGDGLASMVLICGPVANIQNFPTIYPRQKPEPSVIADCTPIFDPRAVNQARDNPASWQVSSNPIIQLIDFLTNSDRGMGFDWDTRIAPVLSSLMAQADICDESVLQANGTSQPRYASNGSFALDADPADVISSILDTCDGWMSEKGDGALILIVGKYIEPGIALEAKHIRGAQLQYGLADEEIVNELTIDYTEPLADYKTLQGNPWRNEADIAVRGRVRSQRFALPWVYSHSQARRLAKRRDAQNSAILRGTITTTLFGLQARGDRWIRVNAPDIVADLADIAIEVRGVTIDLLNAQCVIKFISVNPNSIDAWDPATEEGSAPTIPSKLIAPPAAVPTNPHAVSNHQGPGANPAEPAFFVYFDDPARTDLRYQVKWRVNGSGGPYTEEAMIASTICTVGSIAWGRGVPAGKPFVPAGLSATVNGTVYELQIRAFPPAGAGSAYSGSFTVTE